MDLERLFTSVPASLAADPLPPRYLVAGEVRVCDRNRPVLSKMCVPPLLLGHEPQLGAAEAVEAVGVADRAWDGGFGRWPSLSSSDRASAVERFCAAVEARSEAVARLLMLEIGKPLASARDEVQRSVEYIRNTIAELGSIERLAYRGVRGKTVHHAREHRRPIGRVLCVGPFNYPVNELLTTIIPALLMGNVVVAKTPRFGMLANQALLEAFADAFPPGSVSILPGDGRAVLPAAMATGKIDVFAFIGSERAAHAILSAHPSPVALHKVLGLGAKNPAIVLEGADLEKAASAIVKGALGFNGQRCTAEKLVFAPRAAADAFAERIAARVAALKIGMPWDEGAFITPLPEDGKLEAMKALIDDALAHGARVVNPGGGSAHVSILAPAVVHPVDPRMRLFHEEQFGPVVPVAPYDSIDQVIAWQKASPFGQQAGIWGPPAAARPLVDAMGRLVSRVNLNDVCQRGPDTFGFTATDQSGFGTLSLRDALLTFSRPVILQSPDEAALDRVS